MRDDDTRRLHLNDRHRKWLVEAAASLIAIADDTGRSLVDVIAEVEEHIVTATNVGGSAPRGRRGYELVDGRLAEATANLEEDS